MNIEINQQKPGINAWVNEAGDAIPYNRTTPFERTSEKKLAASAKEAMRLNGLLTTFKTNLKAQAEELYQLFLVENNGKAPGKGKGGITLFNFDRSIKIELSINEQIAFDENTIGLAKAKLDEFLTDGMKGSEDYMKTIIMKAFETSKGKMDTDKILSLRRHAADVKDVRYAEAMALIDKAIRKPKSKEYYRVWVKDGNGKYRSVELNFSFIETEA
jgi:hypothetical protein